MKTKALAFIVVIGGFAFFQACTKDDDDKGGTGGGSGTGAYDGVLSGTEGSAVNTAGQAGGVDATDTICDTQCDAIIAAHCSELTKEECVSNCEDYRAARPMCLAQDTAFRTCFVASRVICSGSTAGVTAASCSAESRAFDTCKKTGGTGGGAKTCSNTCFSGQTLDTSSCTCIPCATRCPNGWDASCGCRP
jgi:hypothetical protein